MKKLLVPSLVLLFAAGMAQSRAGISFGISIGGHGHEHRPPVIVHQPPVVVARPPVVVIEPPRDCEYGHRSVRECEHYGGRHWDSRRSYYRHYRHDDHGRRNGYWRR